MATFQNGNVRTATANTVKAMERSAEGRRCPSCGRRSALVRIEAGQATVSSCRWAPARCDLTEAEAQRQWIARHEGDPDFAEHGDGRVGRFHSLMRAHRWRLLDLADGE